MTGAAQARWHALVRWRHGLARRRHRLERWWRAGLGRHVTPAVLRYVRWGAIATWAVAFGVDCYYRGIHFDRTGQLYWLALGLLAATIGQRRFFYVVVDFVPFAAVLIGYDLLRGGADTLGMPTWWTPQLDVDKFLFGGTEPTVWLQERLKYPSVRWWDVAVCVCYLSFFFLPYLTAAVLWLRNRRDFHRWAGRFVALSFAGFALFALIPSAPPWAAAQCTSAQVAGHPSAPSCLTADPRTVPGGGLLGAMHSVRPGANPWIERLSFKGWTDLHLTAAGTLVKEGQSAVDLVAAVPSLHAGGTLLFVLFMWRRVNRWWRPVLAAYPLLMAFCLVYSAEHYVSDVLAGWLLAVVVTLVAGRIERKRAARLAPDTLNTLPPARRDAPPAAPTDEHLDEPTLETPCLPMTSVPETTPSSI
jgi:membrane-associated phospholipid phosphatase